jgi:hypothetical protein
MRYLCLYYIDPELMSTAGEAELAEIYRDSLALDERLKQSGHYVMASGLARPATARTLRVRRSELQWTDGPFLETKEYLGGFLLIEAADLPEAMRIAGEDALARIGAVEIRALKDAQERTGN